MAQSNEISIRTAISRVKGLGSARAGTEHFWRQRITAIAMVPLLIITIGIVISLEGASFAEARAIVARPLIAIFLLLLALAGTIHMRLGMQVIIEDYIHHETSKWALLMANTFFSVLVGLASAYAVIRIGLS